MYSKCFVKNAINNILGTTFDDNYLKKNSTLIHITNGYTIHRIVQDFVGIESR